MDSDARSSEQRADVERRLQQGEWLKVGDLITLFVNPNGKPPSRSSVDRWISKGARFGSKRIAIRYVYDPSGERMCHPDDIAAALAETRKVRSADHPEGIPSGE